MEACRTIYLLRLGYNLKAFKQLIRQIQLRVLIRPSLPYLKIYILFFLKIFFILLYQAYRVY